jgi:anti-anti-sigma factor
MVEQSVMNVTLTDNPTYARLEIDGVINVSNGDEARLPVIKWVEEIKKASSTKPLVVDLTGLTSLDSAGLGIFVGFFKRLRVNDLPLYFVAPSEDIYKIFRITGVAKSLDVYRAFHEIPGLS